MSFRSAVEAAQYILQVDELSAEFTRKPINYIKLQALLYFMQVQWLKDTGSVCFDDKIYVDTNTNAPYIDDIWRVYSSNGNKPIQIFKRDYGTKVQVVFPTADTGSHDRAYKILYSCRKYDGADLFDIIRNSTEFKESQSEYNGRSIVSIDMLKTKLVNE